MALMIECPDCGDSVIAPDIGQSFCDNCGWVAGDTKMSKTIWKFELFVRDLSDTIKIQAPRFAKFISVGIQHGRFIVWAEVVPEQPLEPAKILVRGTGHSFTGKENQFLGTLQTMDGDLILHFYTSK